MNSNPSEIIFGGRPVVVKTAAGDETVTVRTLKISELPKYFDLMEHDEQMAAFLTGKDDAFIAAIAPQSVLDIVEAGHDVNFTTAQRWAARRVKHIEALAPTARTMAAVGSPNSVRTAP